MRESEPQGKPIDVREWEDGRSEGHPVMGWIGVEHTRNITPRESVLTSVWSCITRDLGQPLQERRQMTVVATLTGALSDRLPVRRLQARMVKVVPQHVLDVAPSRSARSVCKA
jgi:uncharacterized OsmC-like protein